MTPFTIHMDATDTVPLDLDSGTVPATWAGMVTDLAGTEVGTEVDTDTEADMAMAAASGMDTDMEDTAARSL